MSDKQTPTILVFAASNHGQSINRALAEHAGREFTETVLPGAIMETLDINDYEMPIYSPEREKADGIPEEAQKFYDKLGQADALIVSFAEYNGSYTAAYKNLFDWTSRIKMQIYQDRPVVFLAASPGARKGQKVLADAVKIAPFFGAKVAGSLAIGPFAEVFDREAGRLTDAEAAASLREALDALKGALMAQDDLLKAAAA